MRTVITAAFVLAALLLAAPAGAAGPLYSVPSTPTPDKKSIDFANAIGERIPNPPASLGPSSDPTPAQMEERARALARGVVVPLGPESKPTPQGASALPLTSSNPERNPLLAAFVAAAVLALIGLGLAARRRRPLAELKSAG